VKVCEDELEEGRLLELTVRRPKKDLMDEKAAEAVEEDEDEERASL
jgi:hypothetical protein